MSREVALMRRRLATLGRGFTVTQSGANDIVVTAPKSRAAETSRIVRLITPPARLRLFDWEANVLTPNGKTAASQLAAQDRTAMSVSQGGPYGPGSPGPGSMSLYDAVTLAARQPRVLGSRSLSRVGPEYYMFGAAGSAACAAEARQLGASRPVFTTTRCLLAGPVDVAGSVSRGRAIDELAAQLTHGVNASQGQVVVVPQGTVVLQAAQRNLATPVPIVSPAARFFVLRDHVALTGNDITHPAQSTDESGAPDVVFGFTGTGRAAFQRATSAIARRGANVSVGGMTLNQHFAVAVDNQLITVPQIDFRQYPDGIIAGGGADITGGFTAQAAKDMATELRYGALPLNVRVVP
jgi:SecD/SecF fusion protein